jgi:hypothetical protein
MRVAAVIVTALFVFFPGEAPAGEEWREFAGDSVVVESPPRYAHLAAILAREFPERVVEVKTHLGIAPPAPVRVTIGIDARHLGSRLGVGLRPWVAGVALKGQARIGINAKVLRPPTSMPASVILRHELSHLALGRRLGPERSIPLWLEEGICQWVGGTSYLGVRAELLPRLNFDALLAWSGLAERFPADRLTAKLAYLQSFAFVDYLMTKHGDAFLLALVDRVADGTPVHRALFELTGKAQVELEKEWMAYERTRAHRVLYWVQAFGPLTLAAALVVLAWRRRTRVARFLLEEMEKEDGRTEAERPASGASFSGFAPYDPDREPRPEP